MTQNRKNICVRKRVSELPWFKLLRENNPFKKKLFKKLEGTPQHPEQLVFKHEEYKTTRQTTFYGTFFYYSKRQ